MFYPSYDSCISHQHFTTGINNYLSLYHAERECSCLTEKVGVIGIGHAKFGKRTDATIRELAHEATVPA